MSEVLVDTIWVFGTVVLGLSLAAVIYAVVQEMMTHRHAASGGFVRDAMRAAYTDNTAMRVDAILHRLTYDIDGEKLSPTKRRGC